MAEVAMSTMASLATAVRRHPWASALDATLLALVMLAGIVVALEYEIVAFWDTFEDRQRRIRVEEIFLLSLLLAVGLALFTVRRLGETRRDRERELSARLEALANRALAMQDPLTELPNRRALAAALETAVVHHPPDERRLHAYYLLDLNGFKRVNDEHGHAVGDELLRIVAQRFRAAARAEDLVARIGGDEFAVLARDVEGRDAASRIGERFVSALGEGIQAGSRLHPVGVAVGVALYPQDGSSAEELMHHADLAMYMAKAEKRSSLRFFDAA
jgi:diguanylate cyclase (GGDEF)-like protein